MKIDWNSAFRGSLVGWITACALALVYWTNTDTYKTGLESSSLIEQCEKELPRNQQCVIMAVPALKTVEGL